MAPTVSKPQRCRQLLRFIDRLNRQVPSPDKERQLAAIEAVDPNFEYTKLVATWSDGKDDDLEAEEEPWLPSWDRSSAFLTWINKTLKGWRAAWEAAGKPRSTGVQNGVIMVDATATAMDDIPPAAEAGQIASGTAGRGHENRPLPKEPSGPTYSAAAAPQGRRVSRIQDNPGRSNAGLTYENLARVSQRISRLQLHDDGGEEDGRRRNRPDGVDLQDGEREPSPESLLAFYMWYREKRSGRNAPHGGA